jgi:ubiquinone/menaquinone biosynthesis C-methylase UbiE
MKTKSAAFFDSVAVGYDVMTRQDFWKVQISRVLDYMDPDEPPHRVLDLGCGPGISSFVLSACLPKSIRVAGIDSSSKMIERARRNRDFLYPHLKNIDFLKADAARLPFESASFELVVGHSFLYLTSNRAKVLAQIRRVLAPGGALILMEPYAGGSLLRAGIAALKKGSQFIMSPYDSARFVLSMVLWRMMSRVKGRFTPVEIQELFTDAGFAQVASYPTLGNLGMHCVGVVDR